MKKITTIILLSLFFSSTSIAKEMIEIWECTEKYETKVLVKAKISKNREIGAIEVAGTTHLTEYKVDGFNRRWDFDPRDDGRFKYALIIQPNGDGLYYEFPEEGGSVSPSMILECSN